MYDTVAGARPSLLGQPSMVHKGSPSVAAGQVADIDGVPLVRANRGAGETSRAAVILSQGGQNRRRWSIGTPYLSGHQCQERGRVRSSSHICKKYRTILRKLWISIFTMM